MNRFALFATIGLAVALAAPATSVAGGWATVGLSSVPDGAQPGEPWVVRVTVLQHGRTPLEGVQPKVLLRDGRGDTRRSFTASPTGQPGVYRARVVFPSAGRWTYLVDDDFSQVHELGTVRVGAGGGAGAGTEQATPAATSKAGVTLPGALGIALGAGLLAALVTTGLRRRSASKPAGG